MTEKNVIVGGTLDEAAERFKDAWRRSAAGEVVEPQDNITFVSWSALAAVMTDKRHEMLRYLHVHPAASIRALSRDLGRDYKRVHDDVTALASLGLVDRSGDRLTVPYDQIKTLITV